MIDPFLSLCILTSESQNLNMGTILTILDYEINTTTVQELFAYELSSTTVQEHQDGVNSPSQGQSNTPDVNTDLVSCPVESNVEIKSEDELSFNSTSSNEFEGLEKHSVNLLERVKITLDKENNLKALSNMQTSEGSLNEGYYRNCLHSSPHQRLFFSTES